MTATKNFAEQVASLPWYHRMDLGDGVITPGVVDCERVLPRYALPSSLEGQRVLDIGAWDGFYSFEAARRGAERVLATDSFSWDGRGWGSKDSFDLARSHLKLAQVESRLIDPMELTEESAGGRFDVVMHLGVLYHLKDPVTSLELAANLCDDLLILETETALNSVPCEAARFYSGHGLNSDNSNWFQFNVKALRGILSELGFASISVEYRQPLWRRAARSADERRQGRSFRASMRSARVVIHARRAQ